MQLKNSIWYSINTNGILSIGNTGSSVPGLVPHNANANLYRRLFLLFFFNSSIDLIDSEQKLPGLDVISCAKAKCKNSLFNKLSKSLFFKRTASLNTPSTVGDGSSLHGVGGGINGGGNGVAIARLLLSGSTTALDVRELARLLSITSSAKLSDSVKPISASVSNGFQHLPMLQTFSCTKYLLVFSGGDLCNKYKIKNSISESLMMTHNTLA